MAAWVRIGSQRAGAPPILIVRTKGLRDENGSRLGSRDIRPQSSEGEAERGPAPVELKEAPERSTLPSKVVWQRPWSRYASLNKFNFPFPRIILFRKDNSKDSQRREEILPILDELGFSTDFPPISARFPTDFLPISYRFSTDFSAFTKYLNQIGKISTDL